MEFQIDDHRAEEWLPKIIYRMQHDDKNGIDAAVVFIKFGHKQSNSRKGDEVVLRLLDEDKSRKKMLTLRISRKWGTISIEESTVTSSFFFENNRDKSMSSTDRPDVLRDMESHYVGFWIMYRYRKVIKKFKSRRRKREKTRYIAT